MRTLLTGERCSFKVAEAILKFKSLKSTGDFNGF